MQYLSLKEQLLKERQKNARLSENAAKNAADIDYIAMMCEVELEIPETDGIPETEVEEA